MLSLLKEQRQVNSAAVPSSEWVESRRFRVYSLFAIIKLDKHPTRNVL
jgi:hypothetical protein